jgi:hypothetical protein
MNPDPAKKNRDRAHVRHCCVDHGCKYGDDDCPVERGRIEQEYPCERCDGKLPSVRKEERAAIVLAAQHSAGFLRWLAECLSEPRWSRMSDEGRDTIRREAADALRQVGVA